MAGIWAEDRLPVVAAQKFGPPGATLSLFQRMWYSGRLLANEKALLTPMNAAGSAREFTVETGESVDSIATRLEQESFIPNADAFRTFLIYAGLDRQVQAGKYQISPAMTPLEIARKMEDATPEIVPFNILPGWRVEEIAAQLPTSGLSVSASDFLRLVRNPTPALLPAGAPQGATLEGFLMPGQYQIKRGATAEDLVVMFINHFNASITPEMRQGFARQDLDLEQAVTLASIIEREAVVADEQSTIASVFFNRLAQGMKLDSDPTVQYARGYQAVQQTWWKNPLTRDDLQVNSRYNTYIYPGLPPGPISEPGIDALRAVANPAKTGYFYFRAKCDGSGRHNFSTTYEEHLQNGCP
ncbi:MAG TPA: endolytic transglycosylase MltG [Anaerolineaceae bacterium]